MQRFPLSTSVITRSDLATLDRQRSKRLTDHLNSLIRFEMKFREFEFDRQTTQTEVQRLSRILTGDNILITLEERMGKVIGTVVVRPVQVGTGLIAYLGFLSIHEEYRRQVQAKTLMEHAETLSKQLGCSAVQLSVLANNDAAVEFYAAMNYNPMVTYLGKELK